MEYFITIGIVMVALTMFLDIEDPFIPALIVIIGLYSFGILDKDNEKTIKIIVVPQVQIKV